jgi:lipoprotein NlpD
MSCAVRQGGLLVWLTLGLSACGTPGPAPVVERSPALVKPITPPRPEIEGDSYVVQRGDTLYGIAFAAGLDYRELAQWNRLESPDRILIGQVLILKPPSGFVPPAVVASGESSGPPGSAEIIPLGESIEIEAAPLEGTRDASVPVTPDTPLPGVAPGQLVETPVARVQAYSDAAWAAAQKPPVVALKAPAASAPATPTPPAAPAVAVLPTAPASPPKPSAPVKFDEQKAPTAWLWPVPGKVIGNYAAAGGKGIDISVPLGTPVRATADGKVVYSGSGLRGYGNLVIIKHGQEFLSAYAHNRRLLVKEGETVRAGQTIAETGDTGADRAKLHFEIRQYGKPRNPLDFLPEAS